jgi:hypothetical protein
MKLNFREMGDYIGKHYLYHISGTIWHYFNTFGSAREKTMSLDEKNVTVRA